MAYKATYECDLHTHTINSDGNDSYAELIQNAAQCGLSVLAITDHDIVPLPNIATGDKTIPLRTYGLEYGIVVIPGIEFSCDTNTDDVHIVGLGCDFTHPLFQQEAQLSVKSKISGYKSLLEELTRRGMPIGWEEVLSSGCEPRSDADVQRKHIFELIAQKGYAPTWKDAKLMVKNDASLNIRRSKPDPVHIIDLIHATGGISILAHPFLIDEPIVSHGRAISRADYIANLVEADLDGIEASYPYEKTSYGGAFSSAQIEREILEAYKSRLRMISGGSDYHNDSKKGVNNPRRLGEKGVTKEYFKNNELLLHLLTDRQYDFLFGSSL